MMAFGWKPVEFANMPELFELTVPEDGDPAVELIDTSLGIAGRVCLLVTDLFLARGGPMLIVSCFVVRWR